MPRFGAGTLRLRLLLLVLLAVLPAVAVLLDTGFEQRRQAAREAQENARRLALLAARDHGQLIQEGRQLLAALAEVPQVREAKPRACQRLLARLAPRDERFANLGVISPSGEIVCSRALLKKNINVADRPYFRRALESRAFAVGDYQVGRITKRPVLVLAQPVYGAGDQLQSLVYAALNLGWLNHFAARAALPPGSSLTVLDESGTVLARTPGAEQWVGKKAPESLLLRDSEEEREGEVTEAHGQDGEPYLYAIAHMEGLPKGSDIHVVVGIPAREAYAPSDRLLLRNLTVLGVVLMLVLGVAWLGADALVLRRANRLVAAAQRLAAGDLAARTGIASSGDEISAVAATFDKMADALQTRSREAEGQFKRIERLNRVYAVISGINGAILRIRDREALLKETCRIAVEQGGFRLAWIRLIGPDGKSVAPAVYAGEGQGYVDEVRISLDPSIAEGQGPTATALREGSHFVCNDIENDPRMAPWRDRALAKGFRASAAFPLRVEGRVIGALNLYAAEAGFFDAEEVRLLEELAADASLGLEYIAKEERLEHIAFHDPLTGLPNLNLFLDRLRQTLARARHHRRFLAVLVLDIEGFRQTVGALGRHAGDRILTEAARYLAGAVRDGDTVARLEGDEFGVVLADVARLDDVVQVAGKLVHRFPRAVALGGDEIFLKVRAGVAVHPNDGDDADALLKNARLALHHASVTEGDHAIAFYAADFDAAVQEQHRIERALHHAIERGELLLHYQPIVDVATRRIVGLEALARWESAELGPVPPSTFIPIAEETGLIAPLGEWVFKTACRQALDWRERGVHVGRIAVNVSVRELRRADFVERLRGILEELALDPAACPLAIEITESDLMEEREASIVTLERLRRLGLAIYVDDFGTGYSSLGYLMTLPVDALKLDQSFVLKLGSNSQAAAIVKAIVALAHGLQLQVIAEGVETEAQLAALRELGCGRAQGYLFSRPAPASELTARLQAPQML